MASDVLAKLIEREPDWTALDGIGASGLPRATASLSEEGPESAAARRRGGMPLD